MIYNFVWIARWWSWSCSCSTGQRRANERTTKVIKAKNKRIWNDLQCIDKVLPFRFSFVNGRCHWLISGRGDASPQIFSTLAPTPLVGVSRLNEVKDKIERKIACHLNARLASVASPFTEFLLFILIRLKHYKLRWH